jgi:hypothetical protein
MSALPPKADIARRHLDVRFVPKAEVAAIRPVELIVQPKYSGRGKVIKHTTAIFRQVNKQKVAAHHDALEFADGQIVLLTLLAEGQQATVLQLPTEPKCADDLEKQKRAAYVG